MWVVREAYHFSSMLSLHCFIWEPHRALCAFAGLSLGLSGLMALGEISAVHLVRSGCCLADYYGSFLPFKLFYKKLHCEYYGQVYLVALLIHRSKVLIYTAYNKDVEHVFIYKMQHELSRSDCFFCRAPGAVLHKCPILILFCNLPRSKFLIKILIQYFRVGCFYDMEPVVYLVEGNRQKDLWYSNVLR